MADSSSDTAGPPAPTAPLRSASAIRPPRSVRFELVSVFPAPAPIVTDVVGVTHSSRHWLPSRLTGPSLQRYAPHRLFEIANACEDSTVVAGSPAARRSDRLRTFTRNYFTTLYRATRAYLAELTALGADILDGDELLARIRGRIPGLRHSIRHPRRPTQPPARPAVGPPRRASQNGGRAVGIPGNSSPTAAAFSCGTLGVIPPVTGDPRHRAPAPPAPRLSRSPS